MPHSLADDREEERRVFHVAITRSRVATVVVCDERRPSRFVAEAQGTAPFVDETPVEPRLPSAGAPGVSVAVGDLISVGGGFRGVVERELPIGVLMALVPGPGRMSVKWGETIQTQQGSGSLKPGAISADENLVATLKNWRLEVARTQGVPAYVVLTDASLEEVARRRPRSDGELLAIKGIGPAKLEAYGDVLIELVSDAS
jgi:hypothetical protein